MERVELRTRTRTLHGKQVKQHRAQGWIPATVYGRSAPPESVEAVDRELAKAIRHAGGVSLIDLYLEGSPAPVAVLAREIQRNPLTGQIIHADFLRVSLTEKVKTHPHLRFVGEPSGVKGGLAVLLHSMTEVEVECLPTDLISFVEVDVSSLREVGDTIYVRDLPLPPGVVALDEADLAVASLVPTRLAVKEEAEEAAAVVAPEAAAAETD